MAVQVVSTIVLARLLLPEDFGLVAMVVALTGFASVFVDLGTRDAIAQRVTLTEGEVSALFWITFGTGLTFTVVTVAAAPLIGRLYEQPRLEHVAIALSLTFLIPALFYQQHALMRRAMMFRRLAVIDIIANVLSAVVAIALAYWGCGYWALVSRLVLTQFFTAVGVWLSCGWWPGRPKCNTGVKDLLKFGFNIIGFTMTDYVARSADRFALGYATGPRELGYYQNALVVYDNPIALFSSLHNVAVSSLSKLREDRAELTRSWSTALSSIAYFAAPAFAILAVTGPDLVVLLLGGKWAEAGAILSVLALRGPAHVVERTAGWLHLAAGRADRWRRWGLLNCSVMLAALFCGLPFGAMGVATACATFTYLLVVPAIAYSGKPLGIGALDVVKTAGPQVFSALGIAALGFLLKYTVFIDTMPLMRLLLLTLICGVVYLAVMVFGFRMTKPLAVAVSLMYRRTRDA
jgi:PST family polysaccharide transporter